MRQKAAALALFGLVVGCLCTRATLLAVREEGEVVSLAVELAAKEQKARDGVCKCVLGFFSSSTLTGTLGHARSIPQAAGISAWAIYRWCGQLAAIDDTSLPPLCRWWRR